MRIVMLTKSMYILPESDHLIFWGDGEENGSHKHKIIKNAKCTNQSCARCKEIYNTTSSCLWVERFAFAWYPNKCLTLLKYIFGIRIQNEELTFSFTAGVKFVLPVLIFYFMLSGCF